MVTNIAYIPLALAAVMKLIGVKPDFERRGDLSLKPRTTTITITITDHRPSPPLEGRRRGCVAARQGVAPLTSLAEHDSLPGPRRLRLFGLSLAPANLGIFSAWLIAI